MKLPPLQDPPDYLGLIVRRKWWLIYSLLLVLAVTIIYAWWLPDVYVSETLLLVEPREVPSDMVKDLISSSTEERLGAVQQTIESRTNLIRIVEEFEEMLPDFRNLDELEKVQRMRSAIAVETRSAQGRPGRVSYLKISYRDSNPEVAQRITSRLAALFIEFDNKTREQQVYGTAEFLEGEVEKVAAELSETDEQLRRLKQQYRFQLPEQLETNLRTLDRLQQQLNANVEAMDRSMALRLTLEHQIAETPAEIGITQIFSNAATAAEDPLVADYRQKVMSLSELRGKYTDRHPDVIRLKSELQRLSEQVPDDQRDRLEEEAAAPGRVLTRPNPVYQNLQTQLGQVQTEIEIREKERRWIQQEIVRFGGRIESTPERELDLAHITRRYDELFRQYQDLKSKLAQARLAESLESKQKGSQFVILDPAKFPIYPAEPNRLKILLVGLLLSVGTGLAVAFAADTADQKLWTYMEVERLLGVPVLIEIPEIITETEAKLEKRAHLKRFLLFLLFLTGLAGSVLLLTLYPEFESTLARRVSELFQIIPERP